LLDPAHLYSDAKLQFIVDDDFLTMRPGHLLIKNDNIT
jgi:hypothetical protein